MLNYNDIDKLFGTPLSQVLRPHKPYQFKMWHVASGLVGVFLMYKGFQKVKEDFLTD